MSIYVLTTPSREIANEFKIGRTIQDEHTLLSSYTRGAGNPFIIFFKKVPIEYDYKRIEKNILNKVFTYRIKNCNNKLSEWVKIEIDLLLYIINEEFSEMSETKLNINYIDELVNNKEISYKFVKKLLSLEFLVRPNYQREIEENRVDIICKYIMSNFNKPYFVMGSVILSFRDKKLYIVDGLHRLHAIQKIMNISAEDLSHMKISVILLNGLNILEEKKVFKTINMSLPVNKIIVHDDEIGIYVNAVKNIVTSKWKKFITKTEKFHIPNINIDMLINDLVERNLIKCKIENGEVFTVDEYINKIMELNNYIGEKLKGHESSTIYQRHCKTMEQLQKLPKNIIKCEVTNPAFYLGLIPRNGWVEYIFTKETF